MADKHLHALLAEVEAFAAHAGTTPARLLRVATGNPRLYERLQTQAQRVDVEIARLRAILDSFAAK